MGETIDVKITQAQILREAGSAGAHLAPADGDMCDRLAAGVRELGYAIVPTTGDALGPVAVELIEAPNHTPVEDDEGRTAALPSWPLSSGVHLVDGVVSWDEGVEVGGDGDTVFGEDAVAALERDALAVLAAIATHRRAAGRTTPEEQPCTTS